MDLGLLKARAMRARTAQIKIYSDKKGAITNGLDDYLLTGIETETMGRILELTRFVVRAPFRQLNERSLARDGATWYVHLGKPQSFPRPSFELNVV